VEGIAVGGPVRARYRVPSVDRVAGLLLGVHLDPGVARRGGGDHNESADPGVGRELDEWRREQIRRAHRNRALRRRRRLSHRWF
jgi:hypothetical protein